MEMQQVRCFLALARVLNFTQAAQQCGISQPALTRAIQRLEAELGGPLFHRERQRTQLSELGRLMAPYFEAIGAEADRARVAAEAFTRLERARLDVSVMCTIGPSLLADFFASFCRDFPQIDAAISDRNAAAVRKDLFDGAAHVGILAETQADDERFHRVPLFRERFVAVMAPANPLSALGAIPCQSLHDAVYANRANCEYFDTISDVFRERGIRMRQMFTSERDDWVLAMVRAGLGLSIFPEHAVENKAGLVLRPLCDPGFERVISLITVRGRPHTPVVGALLRALRLRKWPGGTCRMSEEPLQGEASPDADVSASEGVTHV